MSKQKKLPSIYIPGPIDNSIPICYSKVDSTIIPLKNILIEITIDESIARTEYTLVYYNDSFFTTDAIFQFPISPAACFDSFKAKFADQTIQGVIKPKKEARAEFQEAVKQGKTAAISEINESNADIMKVELGNLPSFEEAAITYSYIEKLETSMNCFWKYTQHSTLTERYKPNSTPRSAHMRNLSDYPLIQTSTHKTFPWSIKVNINSMTPITLVKSPSHEIVTSASDCKKNWTVQLNPNKFNVPNKDFVLLFNNGKEREPSCLVTPSKTGYTAMLTFFPKFEQSSADQNYEALVQGQEVKYDADMANTRGEYIFLLDRSGSMEGERIEMAKESLKIFIKSLPANSYFNIYSFGSNYKALYNSSQKLNQKTIEDTIEKIDMMYADMGGTEILPALEKIFGIKRIKQFPKTIFLLTDGDVENGDEVISLIKGNSDNGRVFSIGIGNGTSPAMLSGAAEAGNGKCEFVENVSNITGKIISLLDAALTPCCDNFELNFGRNENLVQAISPNPDNLPCILWNQAITFFIHLRPDFKNVPSIEMELRMFDSTIDGFKSFKIEISSATIVSNPNIQKLAIFDIIKRNEKKKLDISSRQEVYYATKNSIETEILNLSLHYGILSKQTAFICVMSENSANLKNKQKVIIPSVASADYTVQRASEIQPTKFSQQIQLPQLHKNIMPYSPLMNYSNSNYSNNNYSKYTPPQKLRQLGHQKLYTYNDVHISNKNNLRARNYLPASPYAKSIPNPWADESTDYQENYQLQSYLNPINMQIQTNEYKISKKNIMPLSNDRINLNYQSHPVEVERKKMCMEIIPQSISKSISHSIPQSMSRPIPKSIPDLVPQSSRTRDCAAMNISDSEDDDSNEIVMKRRVVHTKKKKCEKADRSEKVDTDSLLTIVLMQQGFDGYWEADNSQVLMILFTGKMPNLPKKLLKVNNAKNIWMTILVLIWMESKYQNEKNSWQLIHKKGSQWLSKIGIDYKDYLSEAQACF